MPIPEASYLYPRRSPFEDLGEQMVLYAKFGKRFSIAVLLLMFISPWVLFPLEWKNNHLGLRNTIVGLCIIIGLMVMVYGIVMLILFILYIIKVNDAANATRNHHLRNVFIMELVSMSVFISLNIAGNIVVPLLSRRVESFEIFNIYIDMPGLTFYFFVLIIESVVPRIFKLMAVSNLKKWSDNLGALIYDEDWEKTKQTLSQQLKKMKIGQIFSLIPIISFILPVIYYNGLEKTGKIFKRILPRIEKKNHRF